MSDYPWPPFGWEYRNWVVGLKARLSTERELKELNQLGAEGWEVINSGSDGYLMKRPRHEAAKG